IQGILMGSFSIEQYSVKESIDRLILVMDFNFLIYFAMIFIVYTYHYLKRVKESEKQKNQLETQLVNTRMEMLSSQLQPHFLFNTLNSIAVLVEMDAKKAQNTIADLSDFLREILYSDDHYTVPLEKELRILKYYLNILSVRFSDHLKVEKNIDESLLQHKVPSLILQPIIENSVKHGYSYDHTNLSISIQIYSEKNRMLIRVVNDGEPLKLSQAELLEKGVGLANIRDRLTNLYGSNYFFEIRNLPSGAGVETVVKIPL
ncbi:MAG TPA: histidine kinase, partial [Salinimicrobium sp.]|nr:histidine kinase [Salinimicrobium sp.]